MTPYRQQHKATWWQAVALSACLSAVGFASVRLVDTYRSSAVSTAQIPDILTRLGALEARKCP